MAEAGIRIHGTTRQQPLVSFTGTEQGLLLPLPAVAPELATWARVKVHRDGHVQFERAYYSAPFRLAGKSLWLKATATMVQLYEEHTLAATHLRQGTPGARSTVTDHLPPEAQAWQLHDVQWCLREAKRIGPSCSALVRVLFGDRVLIKLRAVQGLLRFAQQYGDEPPFLRPRSSPIQATPPGSITPKMSGSFTPAIDNKDTNRRTEALCMAWAGLVACLGEKELSMRTLMHMTLTALLVGCATQEELAFPRQVIAEETYPADIRQFTSSDLKNLV
ncbi:Mu transposase domain-containing protein [Cupriavidus lacunae]|uniref:Mu transposase domain-containing protein n=1 Tax=Cupriavidus lacunae TaxID=2666307 RepID=UPI003CC5665D